MHVELLKRETPLYFLKIVPIQYDSTVSQEGTSPLPNDPKATASSNPALYQISRFGLVRTGARVFAGPIDSIYRRRLY